MIFAVPNRAKMSLSVIAGYVQDQGQPSRTENCSDRYNHRTTTSSGQRKNSVYYMRFQISQKRPQLRQTYRHRQQHIFQTFA